MYSSDMSADHGSKHDSKTLNMVKVAFTAVMIAVCSWISIPSQIPFTLQTFAIFTALGLLGGKLGTASVCIYILLGCVGVPVFSGFRGGIGVIAGPTGGYILGFILSGLIFWGITSLFKRFRMGMIAWAAVSGLAMILGNIACYAAGTVHFIFIYTRTVEAIGVYAVLMKCVVPFVIPDIIKISAAVFITGFSDSHRRS